MELTPEQRSTFATNYVAPDTQPEDKLTLTPAEQQAFESKKAEAAEYMLMKAALIETSASRGWPYIIKFAEATLRDLEKEAINEEDDTKANGLRRDAKGARKFWGELVRRINLAKTQEPAQFLEVITH